MRFRFWSDTAQTQFEEGAKALGFPVQVDMCVCDVPEPCEALAFDCGATPEPDQNESATSGVDAFQDQAAFSARSDGGKQYGYQPAAIDPPMILKTKRRSTRGQP